MSVFFSGLLLSQRLSEKGSDPLFYPRFLNRLYPGQTPFRIASQSQCCQFLAEKRFLSIGEGDDLQNVRPGEAKSAVESYINA